MLNDYWCLCSVEWVNCNVRQVEEIFEQNMMEIWLINCCFCIKIGTFTHNVWIRECYRDRKWISITIVVTLGNTVCISYNFLYATAESISFNVIRSAQKVFSIFLGRLGDEENVERNLPTSLRLGTSSLEAILPRETDKFRNYFKTKSELAKWSFK